MRGLVGSFREQGKNLEDPKVAQELNMKFAQKANSAGEAALQKEGLTQSQFEASVKAHSDNPTVGRALGMIQMRQQQELMMLGQPSS